MAAGSKKAGEPAHEGVRIGVILNALILVGCAFLVVSPLLSADSDVPGQIQSMRDELRNLMSNIEGDLRRLETRSQFQTAVLMEMAGLEQIDVKSLMTAAPESLNAIANPSDQDAMDAPK